MRKTHAKKRVPKIVKLFEEVEKVGTEASYRCIRCRGCPDCKKSELIESISLTEELEQSLIYQSVKVNPSDGYISASFPFMCDPTKKLVTNYHISKKIYFSQIKKLDSKSGTEKLDVLHAFKKLID